MTKQEDVRALINTLNRVLKTVSGVEKELNAAIETSSSTLNTLGFKSLLGLSQDSLLELKRSIQVNVEALDIADRKS